MTVDETPVVDLGLGKRSPVTVAGVGWDVWYALMCHLDGEPGEGAPIDPLLNTLRIELRSVIDAAARRI